MHKVDVHVDVDRILVGQRGVIGSGGNSGFQAINIAVQFGATRIGLVGFDIGGGHWHGPHRKGLKNPTEAEMRRWRTSLDRAISDLSAMGVVVIHANGSVCDPAVA